MACVVDQSLQEGRSAASGREVFYGRLAKAQQGIGYGEAAGEKSETSSW